MADKTGMEALIPIVESLYLDYLAFVTRASPNSRATDR